MILKPKILKNVKDVEYMDDFDDWYIFKENSSDYAELPKNMILYGPPGTYHIPSIIQLRRIYRRHSSRND